MLEQDVARRRRLGVRIKRRRTIDDEHHDFNLLEVRQVVGELGECQHQRLPVQFFVSHGLDVGGRDFTVDARLQVLD